MQSFNKLRIFSPALLLACCLSVAHAAPYGPEGRETQFTQPDGRVLTLRVFGDEYYARTETPDGYTVIYNSATGAYHYAGISADGSALVPSGAVVGASVPAGLAKHLDLGRSAALNLAGRRHALLDGGRMARWAKRTAAVREIRNAANSGEKSTRFNEARANAAPVAGNKRGLTILVQFPDDKETIAVDPVRFPTDRAKIERFCNKVGYNENGNTGSVRDYFFDQSLGALTYTQSVTEIITLPRARNYYNFSDYPANREFRWDASRALLLDAIQVLQSAGYDFSSLSKDGSNNVATNIFFAGPDSGSWAQGLWPQQWSLQDPVNVGTDENPINISAYQITNINNNAPVIGTFCHENGHLILDYPDLYSLVGEGVGEHCLMGSGNYRNNGRTPVPINAHFRELVGWTTLTEQLPQDLVSRSLKTTGAQGVRIRNPKDLEESYVVENRGKGDRWAQYAVDKGILIWHIDEAINGNIFDVADQPPHYGVALVQADDREDLEFGRNRGDQSDCFDLNVPFFNGTSTPSSAWWDGSESYVDIEVVTAPAASTRVVFGGMLPNSIALGAPNGGERIFPNSTFNISWRSNITGRVKIELLKDGAVRSTIAASIEDSGAYSWKTPADLVLGEGYSIKVSSLTNPVPANDVSDATFSVVDTTFPAGGQMPPGWASSGKGAAPWSTEGKVRLEGSKSLGSGKLEDGRTSSLTYQSNFLAGTVSFYIKVSSEKDFDLARFSIDGKNQILDNRRGITTLSGDVDWTYVSFPLSAGEHTLKWTYSKDDSLGDLQDRVWIDGVSLPPTTQEIAVTGADGSDLQSGVASAVLPATPVGGRSRPMVFTIRNVGTADLTGLKASVAGTNPGDFALSGPASAILKPGASTTVSVVFAPAAEGARSAQLRIASNDVDESTFRVALGGEGTPPPLITVSSGGKQLADNTSTVDFGKRATNATGVTKTFTITNKGKGWLRNLAVSCDGTGAAAFKVGPLAVTSLAPGASTDLKVTFSPSKKAAFAAALHIASDDTKTGVFDVKLKGTGTAAAKKASATTLAATTSGTKGKSVSPAAKAVLATESVEVVGGEKYRTITVAKQPGVELTGKVQVSPDLLDWFSGKKHTTVLRNDSEVLKVRDNVPLAPGAKRYIRYR